MQFLKNFDPAVMPLGIITLEDVLEGKYNLSPAKAWDDMNSWQSLLEKKFTMNSTRKAPAVTLMSFHIYRFLQRQRITREYQTLRTTKYIHPLVLMAVYQPRHLEYQSAACIFLNH